MTSLSQISTCDPDWLLEALDRADELDRRADEAACESDAVRDAAQASLMAFIRLMWPILEPARALVEGWALHAICEHLQAVSRGKIHRLLINVPPGCMKSLATSVFWPAWEWGPRAHPHLRYVTWSYSESLTLRDNRKCRDVIMSPRYQALWPIQLRSDQNAKGKFENTASGFKIATSIGGVGTGERGDRLVVDDPHNVKESESPARREEVLRWFTESLPTRFNDDDSAIVVIMQRVHERDVSGLILEKELGYEHLCLPMHFEGGRRCSIVVTGWTDPRQAEGELLWPERFSEARVTIMERELSAWGGDYAVAGQLEQRPAPRGGGMFRREDLVVVDAAPAGGTVVRGWDLAASTGASAAYTAGVKLREVDGLLYVEDVRRARLLSHDVEALLTRTSADDDALEGRAVLQDLPQDPGQAGKAQKGALARVLAGRTFAFSLESGDKAVRAAPLAAQAGAGRVRLVKGPWNDAFIAEATAFPAGRFKDQIDAASRAYAAVIRITRTAAEAVAAPRVFTRDGGWR